jgi:phenol phosphorylase subunit alpha
MTTSFLDPHDVPTIPGTEGWERMYPYNYQFSTKDRVRSKYESSQLWYYDGLHYPEAHYPFDLIWDEAWFLALSRNNTRTFMMPPANGIDHRIVNGRVYITPVGVTDPKEIERRVPIFMKRAKHYYENWDRLYEDDWKVKMNALLAELDAQTFKPLPEMEDESVVFENKGTGSGFQLIRQYNHLIDMAFLVWQYHFEFLNLGYAAYVTFINTANSIFPDIPIHTLTKMVSGIDVVMYKPDEELIRLAKLAIKHHLDPIFLKEESSETVMAELAQSSPGRLWLTELEKARYPWFHISTGTGWYHHHRSWNDNLDIPFANLRMHIEAIKKGKAVGRPTEKLIEESQRIRKEYQGLINNDEDRQAFDQTYDICKKVFPYLEDHLFYVEHWFHSVFWNKMRQVGDVLKTAGFLEDREDIWYLKRGEIRDALWDYVTSWATGVRGRGISYWPREIEWRKGVIEKFQAWSPPSALGTPPEVVTEPFTIVLWGVTTDVLKGWLESMEAEAGGEEQNLLKGSPGASGIVEGKARVIKKVEELSELQDGEILVAMTTSPSWAPTFTKISGAVTDVGGAMCHAAIVCREYGLPTVVGTGNATKAIKTGDLIKIDGDRGLVKIIKRAD